MLTSMKNNRFRKRIIKLAASKPSEKRKISKAPTSRPKSAIPT